MSKQPVITVANKSICKTCLHCLANTYKRSKRHEHRSRYAKAKAIQTGERVGSLDICRAPAGALQISEGGGIRVLAYTSTKREAYDTIQAFIDFHRYTQEVPA